jgi:hypothetical protein
MFAVDSADQTTKSHVDCRGEEGWSEEDEDVREDVWSHGCCIVVSNATAYVANDFNYDLDSSQWLFFFG